MSRLGQGELDQPDAVREQVGINIINAASSPLLDLRLRTLIKCHTSGAL